MIIFSGEEKSIIKEAIKLAESRHIFLEQNTLILSSHLGDNKEANEEEASIIKQYEDIKFKLSIFLESLDDNMINLLLVVREIGSSPEDYMHKIYRERFNTCQQTIANVGLSRPESITKLMQFQLGEFLNNGVQHLGNTFEY